MADDPAVWRTVFKSFDRNNDGRVDHAELGRALRALGWSERHVTDTLDAYDTDASGDLSLDEFMALVTGQPAPVDPELVRAFRAMDLDGDGAITASELKVLFDAAGVNAAEEVRAFVAEGDRDGDGRVTFDEFLRMASVKGGR